MSGKCRVEIIRFKRKMDLIVAEVVGAVHIPKPGVF